MDISNLRERRDNTRFTVTELNEYIKSKIDMDSTLSSVTVLGEISNFTSHTSGHLYFSLKDKGGMVKAVMFRSARNNLKFMPENGMKVIVKCSVSVYLQSGTYQLYVTSMQPDGLGSLYLAYEQLKEKLSKEGLFDRSHKKPLPLYPSRVGVITSPTGAAVRDIINVLSRRFPLASVYLYPSLVQGEGAEKNLIEALDYFEKSKLCDVIIIGRGGGSIEDLWAFNSEDLARKIYKTSIPVISAVGHETDFTICDFVADMRAPTPSAAAELCVPEKEELYLRLDAYFDRLKDLLLFNLNLKQTKLERILSCDVFKHPDVIFKERAEELNKHKDALIFSIEKILKEKEIKISTISGKLDALSPLSVLSRGYSLITKNEVLIKSIADVSKGDSLSVRLSDGNLKVLVEEKELFNG